MITTIVLFDVPADSAERWLAGWHESNGFMGVQPGLIDGTLYRASAETAPYRFINVARWENEDALARARAAHAAAQAADGKDQRKAWAELGVRVTPLTYEAVTTYGPGKA